MVDPLSVRTITAVPPVQPARLHDGRPVLEPNPQNAWESRVVLNPAAVLITEPEEWAWLADRWALAPEKRRRIEAAGGVVVLLYRAQGAFDPERNHAPSRLGLALMTPTLELIHRFPYPVIDAAADFHNLGVEDPRCTRVGDTFYLFYTGYYTEAPGDPEAERAVQICLASTQDFLEWTLHGPLEGNLNRVDNKNAALFPEPVDGRWLLLHRPMAGPDAMTIHLAEAEAVTGPWHTRGMLMPSYPYREFARSWIGAGGPPIAIGNERFLMIYHQGHYTREGMREYDLAAALLDFSRREAPVVGRIEPLMRPVADGERHGDPELGVDNVLFTCAGYVWEGQVIIPYAGADSRIFGASVPLEPLVQALEQRSA
ncbi:glycoside hydrolase family 130 protein [Rhodothermus marinus]|uniref:Glycosidase PH1107-related protein n=1 Tax=Rhodothermus marinus (strain ATCC 43812 / DSM 4252 / R-10) TaxID=518766 RepID=D0ME43_RHOM4|nr:glycosidase [Rhodothermus marinus]ACY47267.1 glycosidase PH1107-related protein [Rhodothermus marinus DSM 4252]